MAPDSKREWDRFAVLTFQGGGVYRLSLLGQLYAVHYIHKIIPAALAGTSAGAIIATLYWSGLNPDEITNEFFRLASDNKLAELLGPFGPSDRPFRFQDLRWLIKTTSWRIESIKESFDQPSAARTVASLSLLLRPAFFVMRRFSTHYRGKGLFFGEQLEIELDAMIRKSRKIQRLLAHMPFDVASGRAKITFGHVKAAELKSRAETGTNAIYFPPLLLTSTNVTRRKLIIIDSRDGEFQDLPVARAARISGSFPLFFRPVELANPGDASNPGAVGKPPDLLVDGGVISNFPLWVFGKGFRQRLYRDKDAEWDFLTRLPWQHIGLRRSDDEAQYTSPDDSLAYLKSLAALLTGGARDELEALLEQTMDQRPWIVAQRTAEADGPPECPRHRSAQQTPGSGNGAERSCICDQAPEQDEL